MQRRKAGGIMSEEIQIGAVGDDFHLWAAKEAQRQGELIIASQTADLLATEARATSLVGWTVAGALAGVAVLAGHKNVHEAAILAILSVPVIVAVGACACALWPKPWHRAGFAPQWVMEEDPGNCELNVLQAIAKAHGKAIDENQSRLEDFAKKMRIAWLAFLAIPVLSIAAVLFFG